MHKTQQKVKRFIWLGALLCFLVSNANGCTLMMNVQKKRDPSAPQSVDWDLSQDNEIKRLDSYTLNKFARLKTDATAYEDGIHLTLHLPGNRTFDENVSAVICSRNGSHGDRVKSVFVYFPYMNIEEIERTGNRLIGYWKLERDNFDDWCRERRGMIPEDDERFHKIFETVGAIGESPSLSLRIRHTRDKDKPWHIFWEAYWPSDNVD
jgi:hypothetical protein